MAAFRDALLAEIQKLRGQIKQLIAAKIEAEQSDQALITEVQAAQADVLAGLADNAALGSSTGGGSGAH